MEDSTRRYNPVIPGSIGEAERLDSFLRTDWRRRENRRRKREIKGGRIEGKK